MIRFTENRGQVADTRGEPRPDILYTAGGGSMRLFLRRDGISYVFARAVPDSASIHSNDLAPVRRASYTPGRLDLCRIDMNLIGANPNAAIIAEEPTGSFSNYYLPSIPNGITGVANFAAVRYRDIYPHIDLLLHSTDRHIEYDFVVHPGGRAGDIQWRYAGEATEGIEDGALHLRGAIGGFDEAPPYAYELTGDARRTVDCRFTRNGDHYAYQCGATHAGATLVIDPTVEWATYLGGWESEQNTTSSGITGDAAGNVCAIGTTLSIDFPVSPGAMQGTKKGNADMFITKLTPASKLIWSTYWGGNDVDEGRGIAIDSKGNFAIVGHSASTDFPVGPGAYQGTMAGTYDLIVGVLDAGGRRKWATYLGGTDDDLSSSVAVDAQGAVVVAGETASDNFPVANASQTGYAQAGDAFVAKFNAAGGIAWSTYLGGSDADAAYGISTGRNDEIAVTGYTKSNNFPGISASSSLHGTFLGDAFIVTLSSNGSIQWARYYGGTIGTLGTTVAYDSASSIIIGGGTFSPDLPTRPSSMQRSLTGAAEDGFIAKFANDGTPQWSTYCGGSGADIVQSITIGVKSDIMVVGNTGSKDLPVGIGTYQSALRGPNDAFVLQMDQDGTTRKWATYYGGSSTDETNTAVFTASSLYVIGTTLSTDLQDTPPGYQPNPGGNGDAFIVKFTGFCTGTVPTIAASGPLTLCEGDSLTLTASPGFSGFQWSPDNQTTQSITVKSSGSYAVTARDVDGCVTTSQSVTVRVNARPAPAITPAGPLVMCSGDSVLLSARRQGFVSYLWSNGSTSDQIWARGAGSFSVRVTDTNGCSGTSAQVDVEVRPAVTRPLLALADSIWLCADTTITLDASVGYDGYRWSTGDTTQSITVSAPGLYYVDVAKDGTCGARSDSVAVMMLPHVQFPIIVQGATLFCSTDSVILRVPPGSFTAPLWSTGEVSDSIVVHASGVYYITAIDSNGCRARSDSVSVTVNPAVVATISGPAGICVGGAATYSTPQKGTVHYAWTVSGNGTVQGASDGESIRVQWGSVGTAHVTLSVIDTVSGCSASGGLDVAIGTSLKPTVTPAGNLTLCQGDSIELDAGTGYASYRWSTGAQTEKIIIRAAGAYAVAVTDSSGCSGVSDTVRVVGASVALAVTPAGPIWLASGDSVLLDAGAGHATYRWTHNGVNVGASRTLLARDSGDYVITVADASGCGATASVHIGERGIATADVALGDVDAKPGDRVEVPIELRASTNLPPLGLTGYTVELRYRASMLIPSGADRGTIDGADRVITMSGALPAGITSGELARIGFIAALGDSEKIALQLTKVTWMNPGGIDTTVATTLGNGTFTLTGLCTNGGTRLVQAGSAGLKAITPNPADDQLRIDYDLLVDCHARITLTDMLGRTIIELLDGDQPHGSHSVACDASRLSAGLYLIVLETPDGRGTGVVMVER
jgi:hypothetical protein